MDEDTKKYAAQFGAVNKFPGPSKDEIEQALQQRRKALIDDPYNDKEWWGRSQPTGTIWRQREIWDAHPQVGPDSTSSDQASSNSSKDSD